ncbi:MAG TPA: hypothetical protein VIU41_03680 [Geobacteraceae bacterium]
MEELSEYDQRRPFGLVLLTGLYLFFFLVSASTYGNPFPFLGKIYVGNVAKALVFADCMFSLYLCLGIFKRQLLTWYLLLGYNLFEIVNVIINLSLITPAELEKVIGVPVHQASLVMNNIVAALAILLLTQYIFRHKDLFTCRDKYLF